MHTMSYATYVIHTMSYATYVIHTMSYAIRIYMYICILKRMSYATYVIHTMSYATYIERWGAGVETQENVRGEVGGWGRVPFNEPYAPSLSTIYDGA